MEENKEKRYKLISSTIRRDVVFMYLGMIYKAIEITAKKEGIEGFSDPRFIYECYLSVYVSEEAKYQTINPTGDLEDVMKEVLKYE